MLLHQKPKSIWLTGLSGSGKTTIALELKKELSILGYLSYILDGDIVRNTINKDLGFSIEDRKENIRRIAEINKMFLISGVIVINCFVSPTIAIRALAKEIIGKEDFIEVFVNCTLKECEKRDVKHLYEKARLGIIKDFTGISSPYEAPLNPEIILNTNELSILETVNKLKSFVINKIKV